ncbi:MAG: hypothetical protein KAI38_03550, partial [Candidatus Latescibacteria bacterium]|nr:hypothetical protein [Candidatus Latescibacterota bacterium]
MPPMTIHDAQTLQGAVDSDSRKIARNVFKVGLRACARKCAALSLIRISVLRLKGSLLSIKDHHLQISCGGFVR